MISLQKLKILTPLQKLPKNVGDLGKLIVAKGFEKLLKVQLFAQSGHIGLYLLFVPGKAYHSDDDDKICRVVKRNISST